MIRDRLDSEAEAFPMPQRSVCFGVRIAWKGAAIPSGSHIVVVI